MQCMGDVLAQADGDCEQHQSTEHAADDDTDQHHCQQAYTPHTASGRTAQRHGTDRQTVPVQPTPPPASLHTTHSEWSHRTRIVLYTEVNAWCNRLNDQGRQLNADLGRSAKLR